jgi:catechol 2,3-dioxygenase-like lactoylglutathione lyase family enzyme
MFVCTMNLTAAPAINGVLETALYVDDLPRAKKFYQEVLGFRLMKGDGVRFQAFDDGAGRVLLLFKRGGTQVPVEAPGIIIPPHDGSGPQHVGFAISAESYEPWKARLIALGITIESEGDWPRGGKSLYFRDKDGHLLELITPGIWDVY